MMVTIAHNMLKVKGLPAWF
jgi:hypothetical protein